MHIILYRNKSNVTSGPKDLSHWVMSWCNESALEGCSETCLYVVNDPGATGLTGIKFEGTYEAGISKTVWFKLKGCGDYYEKDRYVGIKAGGDPAEYGNVTGPKGLAADPCAPVPDMPAIVLFASGLVLISVYFVYGRRGRGIANSQ